jgi:hypothetical protein
VCMEVLLVLAKRAPPAGRKLLVVGTTSMGDVLETMGLAEAFNVQLHVPSLRFEEVLRVLRELDAFDTSDLQEVSCTLVSLVDLEHGPAGGLAGAAKCWPKHLQFHFLLAGDVSPGHIGCSCRAQHSDTWVYGYPGCPMPGGRCTFRGVRQAGAHQETVALVGDGAAGVESTQQ